jgi:pyridoxal biosynthesis lyase PdxS
VTASVELAAPYVPGGTVLSAAVRSATGSVARFGTANAAAAATTGGGDVVEATRALQQEAQAFNLQYLQLQESMQRESREFTALSNVMKVKHDSAKSAINNIH